MKTADLSGPMLDLWLARAEGRTAKILEAGEKLNGVCLQNRTCAAVTPGFPDWWQPFYADNSFTAGDIVFRERIEIHPRSDCGLGDHWGAVPLAQGKFGPEENWAAMQRGATPWQAAMRVRVAMVYGAEVPDAT